MSDWKPGDLALCLTDGRQMKRGKVYSVEGVSPPLTWSKGWRGVGLILIGLRHPKNMAQGGIVAAKYFTKITPLEADAFDHEIITLMKPQREGVE